MKNLLPVLLLTLNFNAFAGSEGGGGGDAQEGRVNEIRSDILKWINEGGAKGLKLSIPVEHYEEEMKKILRNKEVALSFTDEKVLLAGVEKTCRGEFIENKPQMLCNTARFEKTTASDQYRLIHHEYAGLANLERNEGAASDYEISNQITDFLREERVLRLAVFNSTRVRGHRKFEAYTSYPCGLSGLLNERIKDCSKGQAKRISHLGSFMIEVFHKTWGDQYEVLVSQTKEGDQIVLNTYSETLWIIFKDPKTKDVNTAHNKCLKMNEDSRFKTVGKSWALPIKEDFGDLRHITRKGSFHLQTLGYPVLDHFYWTRSTPYGAYTTFNEKHELGVVGFSVFGVEQASSDEYALSRRSSQDSKGLVTCVSKKINIFQ